MAAARRPLEPAAKMEVRQLDLFYGSLRALGNVSVRFAAGETTALIGPSGCGKTSLLRCLNRMNELNPEARLLGTVLLDGADIHAPAVLPEALRRRVGMVFERPNPFPFSVFDNVAHPLLLHGRPTRAELGEAVEQGLRRVGLWESCKDRLDRAGTSLPLEDQQRLCIARALANRPEVLLLDEPCAVLDPVATLRLEELMADLGRDTTLIIVTHNMQQAARVSTRAGYMQRGELVEEARTSDLFTSPHDRRTEDFLSGRFG